MKKTDLPKIVYIKREDIVCVRQHKKHIQIETTGNNNLPIYISCLWFCVI